MQYELLKFIKCPLTKHDLKFELISEFEKKYSTCTLIEIKEGFLFSETGFVFPIIDGVPRLLIEAIYDYVDFFKKNLDNYETIKHEIEKKYPGLLHYCIKKNKRTKESFEFEWSFLNYEKKDKIWHKDFTKFHAIFLTETGESVNYFTNKTIIDVGCGHGIMTSTIAGIAKLALGVELSKAVETAYEKNLTENAWYLQGDLQFLPFKEFTFDVLYSSGVIHHTNNTELSLSLIESVLKKEGKICIWLYHPQKSLIHNLALRIRNLTSKIPIKLAFLFLMLFVFPASFIIKLVKRKTPPNYREEIIDLLDNFTPEYRFEIPQDLANAWLTHRNYTDIMVTTQNQFGFAIAGKK